ncbi:MAG TPA: AMP-binding protein, partial [Longimicrobiales bacterium]
CDQLAKVAKVWDQYPALERAVVFDDGCSEDARVLTWSALQKLGAEREAAGAGADFREKALSVHPDDVATLIYTSGTTGEPKGVMLTHNNIFCNSDSVARLIAFGPTDVALSFLPLSHVLQRMVDYTLFGHGSTLAYVSTLDLVPLALVEVRPTITVSTPRVYEKFYAKVLSATGVKRQLVLWARRVGEAWAPAKLEGREPPLGVRLQHAIADALVYKKIRARMGGRLRFFVSGGGPLAPHIARFFYAAGVTILEGYGLTETSPVTNVNTEEDFTIGTVGKPVPGTEIMIADDGEILVRGPQVMKGYFNRPEATAEAIDAEGWFHTGDIGELDDAGHLRITDRKKEIIVTAGGKNIAPQPIENLAKTSRYVAEAVMIGDRRPYPVLLVVPNWEPLETWARRHEIFFREREDLIRNREVQGKVERDIFRRFEELARYETPKKIAILVHDFSIERDELTPTLKVRRRIVEKHYAPVIEQLYEHPAGVAAE